MSPALKDLRMLLDKVKTKKTKERTCPGQIFRAAVSHYSTTYERGHNVGQINIGLRIQMWRLKKFSCPGCEECGWIFEYLPEINDDDFPVEGIKEVENGKAYLLEGVFSPGRYEEGDYDELDGFRFIEWKDEYRMLGRMAFKKGKKQATCPYMKGSKQEAEWIKGYTSARDIGEN